MRDGAIVHFASGQLHLGLIWDLIVSVPDHCLSFYFEHVLSVLRFFFDQEMFG